MRNQSLKILKIITTYVFEEFLMLFLEDWHLMVVVQPLTFIQVLQWIRGEIVDISSIDRNPVTFGFHTK